MKKMIVLLVMLMASNCFACGFSFGVREERKSDRVLYIVSSLALIYAGTHTMINNQNNDLVTNLTGAGVTFIGGAGLYYTIFEW